MSTKLKALLQQVTQAAGGLRQAIIDLDSKIADCHEKRQRIGEGKVSKEEFLAYVSASIDREVGYFESSIERQMKAVNQSFFALEGGSMNVVWLTGERNLPDPIHENACFWYLKPAILARAAEIAGRMDFPTDAIPATERRRMLADLDREIANLNNERDDLAEQLQNAGLAG